MGCVNCGSKEVMIELYEGYSICEPCLDESSDLDEIPYAPI